MMTQGGMKYLNTDIRGMPGRHAVKLAIAGKMPALLGARTGNLLVRRVVVNGETPVLLSARRGPRPPTGIRRS